MKPSSGKQVAVAPMVSRGFDELVQDAELHHSEFDFEGACLLYEEALVMQPENSQILDALGEIHFQMGNFEDARKYLNKSISINPDGSWTKWMYIGQMEEGRESEAAFLKGVHLMEAALQSLHTTASEDVNDRANEIIQMKREISNGYSSLAELFLTDLCDEDGAEVTCEKYITAAVEHDCLNPEAIQLFASLRLCQKREDDAKILLGRLVELYSELKGDDNNEQDEDDENETMGGTEDKYEKNDEAKTQKNELLARHIALFELPSLESRLEGAKMCMEVEMYQEASDLLMDLISECDSNMEMWFLTAEACLLGGDLNTAHEYAKTALAMVSCALEIVSKKSSKGVALKNQAMSAFSKASENSPLEFSMGAMEALVGLSHKDLSEQREMLTMLYEKINQELSQQAQ